MLVEWARRTPNGYWSTSMSDEDIPYEIKCTLGDLQLCVSGPDPEWVDEHFDRKWSERLDESEQMKQAIRRADVSTQ